MTKRTNQELQRDLNAARRELAEVRGQHFDEIQDLQARTVQATDNAERLEKTMIAQRESIQKLKEVARFFRAQRDRVDAYLSGVLDMLDKQSTDEIDTSSAVGELRDLVNTAEHAAATQRNPGRRPEIREPFVRPNEYDMGGRAFASYRDAEPEKGWEDL